MIRKINVTHLKTKNSSTIEGFTEIPITSIDTVANFSVDILYCSILNMIEKNKTIELLDVLAKKIRSNGQLTLVINDIRNICELFINRQISDQQFFDVIDNSKSNISEEQIIKHLLDKNTFEILGIEKNRSMTALSFGRNSND
jgi:hypothetical protein